MAGSVLEQQSAGGLIRKQRMYAQLIHGQYYQNSSTRLETLFQRMRTNSEDNC